MLRFVLREPLNFLVCLFSPVQTTTQTEGGGERKREREREENGRAERGKGGQEMRREKEEKGRKFAKLTVSHSIDTASKEREMNTGLECEKRQKRTFFFAYSGNVYLARNLKSTQQEGWRKRGGTSLE